MENLDDKLKQIVSQDSDELRNDESVMIKNKDGLFESKDIVNKEFVTKDGRKLLKEVRFEG